MSELHTLEGGGGDVLMASCMDAVNDLPYFPDFTSHSILCRIPISRSMCHYRFDIFTSVVIMLDYSQNIGRTPLCWP